MKIILILAIVISALTFSQNQSLDYNNNLDPISFKNDQSTREKRNETPNSNNRIITNKVLLENGYILIEQIHLWGSGSDWLNYQKINLTYDNNNQLIAKHIFSWDDSVWVDYQREIYNYDNFGNDTMTLKQYWAFDKWINNEKIVKTFDSENNIIQTINQNYLDSIFINQEKRTFVYDLQNNLIEEIYQWWVDSGWDNRTRTTKFYSNANSIIEIINEDWNGFEWRKNNQRLFEYDGNNNETLEILSSWNGTDWYYETRWISNYNSNNLISEFILDEFFENSWLHQEKNIYSYNSSNLLEDRKLRWRTFEWDTTSRVIYSYNSNDKNIERKYQFYRNLGWEDWTRSTFEYDVFGNLSVESSYTWVFTEWVNNHRYINSYTQLTSIESVQTENMHYFLQQNYPNPFNPSTKISWQSPVDSWQTLKIYDILGNEVATLVNEFREAGSYNEEFRMQNLELSSGIYFYQLRIGKYVETKKMVLLK